MLGNLFNKSDDVRIKKDMEKRRDKIIAQATRLHKLVSDPNSGWREYVALLEEYVQACKVRKAITALDTADNKTLEQLKLLDHEVWLINSFILKIPEKIFGQEKFIEKANQQEEDERGNDD